MSRVAELLGYWVAGQKRHGAFRRLSNPATQQLALGVIAALAMFIATSASACPVCFGAPNSPASKGMNNAIVFLLTMVGFVQIGFVALFWSFWKRAKELRRRREQFHLIEGGAR